MIYRGPGFLAVDAAAPRPPHPFPPFFLYLDTLVRKRHPKVKCPMTSSHDFSVLFKKTFKCLQYLVLRLVTLSGAGLLCLCQLLLQEFDLIL